ncbi:unnamed protein product [Kuraishia capsulata CBS 1993]|uniref:DUF7593 domain-containing protein n=1 Tax=Kuraishia capsulata CBS 1993 TaxID=1382522 RepID=W6MKK7_9ASCO|nr:uncharacterized protein KUCA_T00002495001 [Kuraishia capsulata CBS 1993]CDK26523.1 unnamed protein product [Kuraishia capsulata CBS 1993]
MSGNGDSSSKHRPFGKPAPSKTIGNGFNHSSTRPGMFGGVSKSTSSVFSNSNGHKVDKTIKRLPVVYTASGKPSVVSTSSGLTLSVPKKNVDERASKTDVIDTEETSQQKEESKEPLKEEPKEGLKEEPKEDTTEEPTEEHKEEPKEEPKDHKSEPKEQSKDDKEAKGDPELAPTKPKETTVEHKPDLKSSVPPAPERSSSPVKTSRKRAPKVETESEAETDIEDVIPVPSRAGRRLVRRLEEERNSRADNSGRELSESESENGRSKSIDVKKRDQKMSRSSSPNRSRKVSKGGRDSGGRSRLQRACEKGKYEEVVELIEAGADVNDSDNAGTTCLQEAALNGHVEIARLLLDNGADVDKQSGPFDKDTALIDAAANNHLDIVKLLIERGADPTITNVAGQTAFDAIEDPEDEESVQIRDFLIEYTRKFREMNRTTDHPAEVEEEVSRKKPSFRRDPLLVDFTTKEGRQEIFQRAAAGDEAFVGNYLSNGGKPHTEALSAAALHGHTDIASLLLAFGAKIDTPNSDGVTPLMFTVGRGHRKTAELLLSNGANPTIVDSKGRSVLDAAIQGPLADEEEIKVIRTSIENWKGPKGSDASVDYKAKKRKSSMSKPKPEKADIETRKATKEPKKKKVKIVQKSEEPVEPAPRAKSPVRTSKGEVLRETTPVSMPAPSVILAQPPAPIPVPVPVALTPEEEEAKKAKERELQRQREAYELQRQERIKAKQMQIMSSITQSERRREEEKKKAEIMEQQRLELQKAEEQKKAREAEEQKKHDEIRKEMDRKKQIRSLYPGGLAAATFQTRTTQEVLQYLPLYIVEMDGNRWCLDIQVNLVLGVERLYKRFPSWEKVPVTDDYKIRMWRFLSPMLGTQSGTKFGEQIRDLQTVYSEDESKFLMLMLHWVKLEDVAKAIESDFPEVAKAFAQVGTCELDIGVHIPPSSSSLSSAAMPSQGSDLLVTNPSDYTKIPRAFRGRSKAMKLLGRNQDFFPKANVE